MKELKIAILGSGSHIAKGLINNFLRAGGFSLHLHTRSSDRVRNFLHSIEIKKGMCYEIHEGYEDLEKGSYDVVINCVGAGTLKKMRGDYTTYFTLTEEYDNLAINYLREIRPAALYISFSSGAVYGRSHSEPVNENSVNRIKVNCVTPEDYYSIVRLNAEAKHRAFHNLNIVDLRIFSYFSRFMDLNDGYFITDVMDSILKNKTLVTDNVNIVRDYLHPQDLFSMVMNCIALRKLNRAFDVVSSKPVEKREILDYFASEYGLKYEIGICQGKSATGLKSIYCSASATISDIGYVPQFSSMHTIQSEAKYILPVRLKG